MNVAVLGWDWQMGDCYNSVRLVTCPPYRQKYSTYSQTDSFKKRECEETTINKPHLLEVHQSPVVAIVREVLVDKSRPG